ncbi:MAG: FliH/SctL family protein [Lachnospiraceae bacterium]
MSSNLYKQRFINSQEIATRVINSNQMVEEKLEELSRKMRIQAGEEAGFTEGFSSGLGAERVDAILKEPEVDYVAQAKEEAEEILAQAKAKADAILINAEEQKKQVLLQAEEEGKLRGYEEGKAKADAEEIELRRQLQEVENSLHADYQRKLEQMEPQLVDVVAKVFEKVFHIQFGDKTEILLSLISDAIMDIEGSKEFRIRVANVNFEFIESRKREIEQRVGEDISLEVISDPLLEENQCTIETDSGMFDCSLGVQLENLIKDLKSLSIN